MIQPLERRQLLSVTLTDNGSTVTLANGTVSLIVQKTDGRATSLKLGSSANLLDAGSSKGMYFDSHVSRAGSDIEVFLGGSTYTVVTNTSQMVDIAIQDTTVGFDATTAPNGLIDVTQHYVMRNGDAGFYTYFVVRHDANQPATYFANTRQVVRTDPNVFTSDASGRRAWSYSSPTTKGMSIGSDQLTNDISDQTYELPSNTYYSGPGGGTNYDGNQVWTKYDWSVYQGPTTSSQNTWGVANDKNGVWMISPSNEFNSGGPTKLKPGTQQSIVLNDFDDDHALGSGADNAFADGEVFQKVFGPLFIYANAGTNHDTMWQDAQNRGAQEVAAWPYAWVSQTESAYPRSRGTVTGVATVGGGQFSANAEIILGDGNTDFKFQGAKNYLFWTQADSHGQFTIPKVRPGTYTLWAYVPGVEGEWQLPNVVVTANQTTNLGVVNFTAQDRQSLIWQIGTPDRSTAEFRFGDQPRQFGLWWKYLQESGAVDRTFVIGQSNPKTDWYYAQPIVALDNGTWFSPKWNIQFNLTQQQIDAMNGSALITLGLAGSIGTAFYVDVNGPNVVGGTPGIFTPDDSGLNRENTTLARFTQWAFSLNSGLFHTGTNTITLRVRQPGHSGTWTGTHPSLPLGGIQYDFVRLESGTQIFPAGWTNQDVGSPGIAGSTVFDSPSDQWTINGAGSGLDESSDQFQFVSHNVIGDNTLVAQVTSATGGSKDGLVIRDSLTADAPYAGVFVSDNVLTFQTRSASGAPTMLSAGVASSLPVWLKLQRAGDQFSAFYSTDGFVWNAIGTPRTITMNSSFLTGLAVTSGIGSSSAMATFTHVSISDPIGAPALNSASFEFHQQPNQLELAFNKSVASGLTPSDLLVQGPGGSIYPTDVNWNSVTSTATFTLPASLPDGNYHATLPAGSVHDDLFQPLLTDYATDFFVLIGDANHDRHINTIDFTMLAQNFNQTGAGFGGGDFNNDGAVNALDFNLLASKFGTYLAPSASPPLPEPLQAPAMRTADLFADHVLTDPKTLLEQ